MKVLVACEMSGVVREAFRKKGHDAYSCDLLPSLDNSPYHYQADVFDVLFYAGDKWGESPFDLMIAHPPCTYLTVAGNKWMKPEYSERFPGRLEARLAAIEFVKNLMDAPIDKIAVENPVSVISSYIRKPDQTVQPWQFGHGEVKRTCLWLKGLPKLIPTDIVEGREPRLHNLPPSKDRAMLRSITYQGIADAMAEQWG